MTPLLADAARGLRASADHLPLFVHVVGAMVMVGGFVLALISLLAARRGGELPIGRLGFRALLFGALPGAILMRVGAEWLAGKEGYHGSGKDPTWLGIGYMIADPTVLFLLIALLLSGLSLRRARRSGGAFGGGMVTAASVLIALTLVASLVAVFAMTTKPT